MVTQALDNRKMNLIVQITHLDNEESVRQVEDFVSYLKKRPTEKQLEMLKRLAKPMRKKLDIDELIKEQNWKPSTQEEIEKLIKKIDFQIPLEELIREINDI